jgi:hypothetical protein
MGQKEGRKGLPADKEAEILGWALKCKSWGEFSLAFKPKGRSLSKSPDIPDYTGLGLPTGRLQKIWSKAEEERKASVKKAAAGRDRLPTIVLTPSSGALELKDAARTVRENVLTVRVEKADAGIIRACEDLDWEFHLHECRRAGLRPLQIERETGLRTTLDRGDFRMFALRYEGPDVAIRGAEGEVELKKGNVLGYHIQRTTKRFDDAFFAAAIEAKGRGFGPLQLYGGLIYGERGDPIEYRERHGFDKYNYGDLHEADDSSLHTDNKAVFLTHINVLPAMGGMGLSEPFLRDALAFDLDREGASYAFAYARMSDLYRKYVPEGEQERMRQLMIQRRRVWATGGTLGEDDTEFIGRYIEPGGTSQVEENFAKKRPDGLSAYSTIRFHERAGGIPICAIPICSTDDLESLMAGALVVYDLKDLRRQGRI